MLLLLYQVSVAKCEWSSSRGSPYILVLRQSDLNDPPKRILPSNLQLLVNRYARYTFPFRIRDGANKRIFTSCFIRDNQKYSNDRRYPSRVAEKKRDYDDDYDDMPPSNDSLGGPGPPLVF